MYASVIWVTDLVKSIDFYSKLFETNNCVLADGYASVTSSTNEVLLHLLPEEYRSEPSYGELNPIKPVFEVDRITDFASLLRGAVFVHGDWSYADLVDPDGHIIQIREKA